MQGTKTAWSGQRKQSSSPLQGYGKSKESCPELQELEKQGTEYARKYDCHCCSGTPTLSNMAL